MGELYRNTPGLAAGKIHAVARRPVRAGDGAPDFELPAHTGENVRLSHQKGHKVWLAFFRHAGCPLCYLRVHEMAQREAEWTRRGLRVLAVFQNPVDQMTPLLGAQPPGFPLLSDTSETVYHLYGLGRDWNGFLQPALALKVARARMLGWRSSKNPDQHTGSYNRLPGDFLIDKNGVVRDAFFATDGGSHIPFGRV